MNLCCAAISAAAAAASMPLNLVEVCRLSHFIFISRKWISKQRTKFQQQRKFTEKNATKKKVIISLQLAGCVSKQMNDEKTKICLRIHFLHRLHCERARVEKKKSNSSRYLTCAVCYSYYITLHTHTHTTTKGDETKKMK